MLKIKNFFTDLWIKVKTDVVNAVTLVCGIIGGVFSNIDKIAATLDPNFGQQLATFTGDLKWVAHWALGISVVGMIANFKKLVETPKG